MHQGPAILGMEGAIGAVLPQLGRCDNVEQTLGSELQPKVGAESEGAGVSRSEQEGGCREKEAGGSAPVGTMFRSIGNDKVHFKP